MTIERLQPGDEWMPPRASDHNAMAEAAEDYMRRKNSTGGTSNRKLEALGWLHVQNVTGGSARRGEVLEVFDLLPSELADDELYFEADTPQDENNTFGIVRELTPDDGFSRLILAGRCRGLVNVTDEDHMRASLEADNQVLQSSTGGPVQIIWKPTGTGEKECVLLLGGSAALGCYWVRFKVQTATPETLQVKASVMSTLFGCSLADVPGRDTLDLIDVCDPRQCWFNETEDDLLAREGFAQYMMPLVADGVCQTDDNYLVPQWEVVHLCCPFPQCDES